MQTRCTGFWHSAPDLAPDEMLLSLAHAQHKKNFDLWHQEDMARDPAASDSVIATVKRNIDKLNQQRNDLIEKLDEQLQRELLARGVPPVPEAPFNSETPGSIIDRLSILSLKIFHMREQAERTDAAPAHLERCRQRLEVLTRQREDLAHALSSLLDELGAGQKQLKLYRQFKMYNDPESNPEIYKRKA